MNSPAQPNTQTQVAPPLLDQKILPKHQSKSKANGPRTTVAKLAIDATREVDALRISEFNLYVKSTKYFFSTVLLFLLCLAEAVMLYLK